MPALVIENTADSSASNTGTYGLIFSIQNKTTSINIVQSLVFFVTTSAPATYTLGLKYYIGSTKDSLSSSSNFTGPEITSTNGTFTLSTQLQVPASNYMNIFVYVKTNPYSTAIISRYSGSSIITPGSAAPSTYFSSSDFNLFTGNGVDSSKNSGSPVPTSWVFDSVTSQGRIPRLTINYAKASPSPSPSPSPPRPSPSPSPSPSPPIGPAAPTNGYDIIVVAGQSNALGYYATPNSSQYFDKIIDPDIHILKRSENVPWNYITADSITRLNGTRPSSATDNFSDSKDCSIFVTPTYTTIGTAKVSLAKEPISYESADSSISCCSNFALKFCKDYKAMSSPSTGRKILLVHVAVGSTALTVTSSNSKNRKTVGNPAVPCSWSINESGTGNLRTLLSQQLDRCNLSDTKNKLVAVLWQQGEEDSDVSGVTEQSYRSELTSLVTNIRAKPNCANVPFFIGGFTDYYLTLNPAPPSRDNVVRAQKNSLISKCYYIGDGSGNSTWDDRLNKSNGIHYNALGQYQLALLYMRAFIASKYPSPSPSPTNYTSITGINFSSAYDLGLPLSSSNMTQCATSCDNTPSCTAFSLSSSACILKQVQDLTDTVSSSSSVTLYKRTNINTTPDLTKILVQQTGGLDAGDPSMIRVGSTYYLTFTCGAIDPYDNAFHSAIKIFILPAANPFSISTINSDALANVTFYKYELSQKNPSVLPYTKLNSLWAPQLKYINNKMYIFFCASETGNADTFRLYYMVNSTTDYNTKTKWIGPFSLSDSPKVYDGTTVTSTGIKQWSIDPNTLTIGTDNYLLFSFRNDGRDTSASNPQKIGIRKITFNPDGTIQLYDNNIYTLSRPDQSWELNSLPVNEGPIGLTAPNGKTHIIYSASLYLDPKYCLGRITLTPGANPLLRTSWTKTGPVFIGLPGTHNLTGTGKNSFTDDASGNNYLVYHGRKYREGDPRSCFVKKFTWDSVGNPIFGTPIYY
jgi:GH43 family beta-xylosidase